MTSYLFFVLNLFHIMPTTFPILMFSISFRNPQHYYYCSLHFRVLGLCLAILEHHLSMFSTIRFQRELMTLKI